MEFKEIKVPEGNIIQQIDHEGPFAGITIDVGNVDTVYPNVNLDMSYEDTLPKKVLSHNWSSRKMVDEINMDRVRYLLNTDEMSEEMLGEIRG